MHVQHKIQAMSEHTLLEMHCWFPDGRRHDTGTRLVRPNTPAYSNTASYFLPWLRKNTKHFINIIISIPTNSFRWDFLYYFIPKKDVIKQISGDLPIVGQSLFPIEVNGRVCKSDLASGNH